MLLPPFTEDGLLPPDDYKLTLPELQDSILVKGPEPQPAAWDSEWRSILVKNLAVMANQLWEVGIERVFVDGSFVEDKLHPNDIDGYFEVELEYLYSGQLQRDLNALDPHKIWTWAPESRRPYRNYPKKQLPMWHQYRVELYPHYNQPSGITDEFGNMLQFPAAFRKSRREHKQKGIIELVRTGGKL